MAWLTGWGSRKSHAISGATGAGTLYQTCIKVYKTTGVDGTETVDGVTAGKVYLGTSVRDDFGDVRFTDNDGSTLLDCWMQSYTSGTSAIFWVEVTDSLSLAQTIYVYYNKADATYPYLATDTAQGEATFLFFDHFPNSTIDTNKWQGNTADATVASSIMTHAKNGASYIYAKTTYGPAVRYRAYGQYTSIGGEFRIGFDSGDNVNDVSIQYHIGYSKFKRVTIKAGAATVAEMATARDNNYHILQAFFISTSSCKFQIDDVAVEENTTNIPIVAVPPASVASSGNNTIKIDWVFVSKYVDPEPAHSTWGTEETIPTVTTQAVSSIEETTSTGNGNITVTFENCTKRGICWNTTGTPTIADYKTEEIGSFGTGAFTEGMTSLSPGTLYYVRAYAYNSAGYGYGNEVTFTTKPNDPSALSDSARTNSSISIGWTKGSGAEKTMIRYRTDTYPTGPTDGTQGYFDTGSSGVMTSLSPGQIYYYRAWSYCTLSPGNYSDGYAQDTGYTAPGDPSDLGCTVVDSH
jgi:hypothetical protein